MNKRKFLFIITCSAVLGLYGSKTLSKANNYDRKTRTLKNQSANPINIGSKKQLFLDEKFIDSSTGIRLRMNPPVDFYEIDFPELNGLGIYGHSHGQSFPTLIEYEDGYRLYYHARPLDEQQDPPIKMLCLSTSKNLFEWEHGKVGLFNINGSKNNNVVLPGMVGTPFIDPQKTDGCPFWFAGVRNDDNDPPFWREVQGTIQGLDEEGQREGAIYLFKSRDGLCWKRIRDGVVLPFWCDPPSLVLYDPRIAEYVAYVRGNDVGNPRKRFVARAVSPSLHHLPFGYKELADYPVGRHGFHAHLIPEATLPVIQADGQDPPSTDIYSSCMNIYPWAEDVYLAFPSVYRHYDRQNSFGRDHRGKYKNDGVIEVQLAVSRDGINFHRFREPFVAPGLLEDIDRGGCVFMGVGLIKKGNYLYQIFEESGLTHREPHNKQKRRLRLAIQRLDGFVSAEADANGGALITPPINFTGNRLQLNIDCGAMGEVWVELQDKDFNPISGFTMEESVSVDRNELSQEVWWQKGPDVGELAGKPVRLHFKMRSAKLYAFQFAES